MTCSELRHISSQEPAAVGHLPGRAAEVGEPAGEEDPQEAPDAGAVRTLLAPRLHEGSVQPVLEEAHSTAPTQQDQVEKTTGSKGFLL